MKNAHILTDTHRGGERKMERGSGEGERKEERRNKYQAAKC